MSLCRLRLTPFVFIFAAFFITTVSPGYDAQNKTMFAKYIKEAQDLMREGDYDRGRDNLIKIFSYEDQSTRERPVIYELLISLKPAFESL